jgi:hypothetical protein
LTQILRVRTVFTGFTGAPGLMTQYFTAITTAGDAEDALLAANRVKDALDASTGLFPDAVFFNRDQQVDFLNDADGEVNHSEIVPAWGFHGTGGANQGPSPTGMLVRWKTSTFNAGRLLQGHTFLVPIIAGQDPAGSPNSTQVSVATTFGTEMLDAGLTGLRLVVWRRPKYEGEGDDRHIVRDGMSAVVTSSNVPDKFTVLRSRRD